ALTDRFVATCKAARGQAQTDYFDERTPGLALRVSKQGHKAWSFIFTAPGNDKRARITCGTYPAMSLAAARTRAREARGLVEAGGQPPRTVNTQTPRAKNRTAPNESLPQHHTPPKHPTPTHVPPRPR